ncbi:MAG: DUF1499 domain-containing protein [Hyphomicrobiaceae bacterium]|nr:MAG: DUF1499 domain-containing protein [Hyphomicrobiaceae bacterium]
MSDRYNVIVAPLARWSSRIAFFAASLIVADVALHRLTSFPTPVALNLFRVGYGIAALAVLVGLVAMAQIWRRGYGGAGRAAIGVLLPILLAAWPLAYVPAYMNLPPINDITTDPASPPRFAALSKLRPAGANSPNYPGERFALLQQQAFPDVRTLVVERSLEETFELVEESVAKLRWKVAATEPPVGRPARAGILEATDRTLLVGFTDDIVIRVEGNATRSRVDVRSASRFGTFDFGQNANRVRRLLAEVQARADATTPSAIAGRRGLRSTRAGAVLKKLKARDQKKAESRSERDRAPSSAQRVRAPRESQR